MAEEIKKGLPSVMRYCDTLADYEQNKADGKVTDDVFVIILEDKIAKFKGHTFNWTDSGSGGGSIDLELLETYMPLSRDFSDDFNNDFAR